VPGNGNTKKARTTPVAVRGFKGGNHQRGGAKNRSKKHFKSA
jgi:hypothetical protein